MSSFPTGCCTRKSFKRCPSEPPSGQFTNRWSYTTPMLTSPPLRGMIHAHQPGPARWLVAVERMPKQAFDQSGNFCASSAQSKSFTPVQRDQTAVVGCSVLGRSQPSCLASSAATPEASTTQRAETVLVSDCESLPAVLLISMVCGP